jgi:catechol 2,3-dioxygenase-like lactoylglutathione lyase family enzyme
VFDHVTIRVTDRGASERFYNTVLPALGIPEARSGEHYPQWDDFSLSLATEAGYEDDGAPGPRPQYGDDYYGAFLLDPDGNSIEAVHHGSLRTGGRIDHLWIRVADVAASQAFYDTIAPHAGFRLRRSTPDRAQFTGGNGSFSVVSGRATEPFHVAFPASDDETVDAFHRTALAAGYADNGAPGERKIYHPGYYGAFVLDPDGNNVEVVNHNRG